LTSGQPANYQSDFVVLDPSIRIAGRRCRLLVLRSPLVGIVWRRTLFISNRRLDIIEFATLRALGVPASCLRSIVLAQASWLSVAGLVLAALMSAGIFTLAHAFRRDPIGVRMSLAVAGLIIVIAQLSVWWPCDSSPGRSRPVCCAERAITGMTITADRLSQSGTGTACGPRIDGLNFIARPGEMTLIVGPSGCGREAFLAGNPRRGRVPANSRNGDDRRHGDRPWIAWSRCLQAGRSGFVYKALIFSGGNRLQQVICLFGTAGLSREDHDARTLEP